MHAQTPVQQYPLSSLTDLSSEKSKHLHLSFPSTPDGEPLHFVIGDKHTFEAIVNKIEEGRGEGGATPNGVGKKGRKMRETEVEGKERAVRDTRA